VKKCYEFLSASGLAWEILLLRLCVESRKLLKICYDKIFNTSYRFRYEFVTEDASTNHINVNLQLIIANYCNLLAAINSTSSHRFGYELVQK